MLDEIKNALGEMWISITKPVSQFVAGTTTAGVSALKYFNSSAFDAVLTKFGIICGIGVSISLIALNVLRFINELREKPKKKRR